MARVKCIILSIILFCLYTSCSLENSSSSTAFVQEESVVFQWHLISVIDGMDNLNHTFEEGTIIWIFRIDSAGSGTLTVSNKNTQTTLEDGLDTGIYSVTIPTLNSNSILFVENTEYGVINTDSVDDLIIDQNVKSDGAANSGFKYVFRRRIVEINN